MRPSTPPPATGVARRTILAGLVAATSCPALAGTSSANASVPALLDELMQENLRAAPELATTLGLDVGAIAPLKRRLNDRSMAGVARERRKIADQLRRVKALETTTLARPDLVNLKTVRATLERQSAFATQFAYGAAGAGQPYVVSHLGGAYQSAPELLASHHTVHNADDAEAYLSRLTQFATELGHETERVRRDAEQGVTPPLFVLDRTLQQQARLQGGAASAFATPLAEKARNAGLSDRYAARAEKIVAESVVPALAAQGEQLRALRSGAGTEAGVWRLPDGGAYYAAALGSAAEVGDDAETLHALGLELVAQIGSALDELLRRQGYARGPRAEQLRALQADPRYVYPNDAAGKAKLLDDVRAKLDAITTRLPRYFHQLPRTPVDVRAVPEFLEAGAPFAYYQDPSLDGSRPGIYYINLQDTAAFPAWLVTTTTFHEALPGHHMQQVVLQEGAPMPLIRKAQWSSAYTEGWGLYAEQLADELGMYEQDPVGQIGYQVASLLRAARLVADTGLHAKRWTREQAIAWMSEDCGLAPGLAANEVERYCVWPGQACSYMVGRITWNRLRERSKRELGQAFDIRDFHQAGLEAGAVPLSVLEEVIGSYIAAKTAAPIRK